MFHEPLYRMVSRTSHHERTHPRSCLTLTETNETKFRYAISSLVSLYLSKELLF